MPVMVDCNPKDYSTSSMMLTNLIEINANHQNNAHKLCKVYLIVKPIKTNAYHIVLNGFKK